MRQRPLPLLVLASLLLVPSLRSAAELPIGVETEPAATAGVATLLVRAFDGDRELSGSFAGAQVSMNHARVGTTPWESASVAPGTWLLGIEARGYRPRSLFLTVAEKTRYEIRVPLERKRGWLELRAFPPDAELLVDGSSLEGRGPWLLDEGERELLVRRFGYVERRLRVEILDGLTSRVSVSLDEAPFSVSELAASRSSFNPRNAGPLGRTTLSFEVSSYGSARLEILGPGGEAVFVRAFPAFVSWGQEAVWDGRLEDGSIAPDGAYLARLEARAAPGPGAGQAAGATGPVDGEGRPSFVREARLLVDSTIVVHPRGLAGGSAGLLYMPDPRSLPAGTAFAQAGLFARGEAIPALGLGAAISLGGSFLAFDGVLEPESSGAASLRLSLLSPLLRGPLLDAALDARLLWSSGEGPRPPFAPAGFGLELGLPLALRLAPPGGFPPALGLGLEPLLALRLGEGASLPETGFLARAGAWAAGPRFRLGLSGEFGLSVDWSAAEPAPLPDWPARAALEAILVLDPTPLTLSGGIFLEAEPGLAPGLGLWCGLGLLF